MLKKFRFNRSKVNFWLDLALVIVFPIALEFGFTGLRLHELLGLFFGIGLLIHLVLHLDWVVNITKTFFRNLWQESRLNYVLNWLLFIDGLVMVVSGLLISRTLGLSFSVGEHAIAFGNMSWRQLHVLSAEFSLLIIAFHVAMHWKWIITHTGKYLFGFVPWLTRKLGIQNRPITTTTSSTMEVQHGN